LLFAGFMKNAGIDMVLVPYRETNVAVTDLAEGRLQIIVSAMATLRAQVDAGKIRQLAVTNKMRPPHAPNIPTALEAGFPDLTYEGLLGLFGARDLPAQRRSQIAADISAIAADPAVAKRLSAIGLIARSSSPDEFSASLAAERAKMAEIMRLLGHPEAVSSPPDQVLDRTHGTTIPTCGAPTAMETTEARFTIIHTASISLEPSHGL
jgi:tripartite-type tricarboxylate transporter receptor subunit TctC